MPRLCCLSEIDWSSYIRYNSELDTGRVKPRVGSGQDFSILSGSGQVKLCGSLWMI